MARERCLTRATGAPHRKGLVHHGLHPSAQSTTAPGGTLLRVVAGASKSEFDQRSLPPSSGAVSSTEGERTTGVDAPPLYMSESYAATSSSVPQARKVLTAFAAEAGIGGQRLEDIRLAVSEAITNAVAYAYDGPPGEIHVLAASVAGELWVVIADDGEGMRERRGDTRGLGLGLGLMARLSNALTILTRSSGGVEVRMRFDMP
jgi:serine/threonine-protein kinase RsbW